MKKFYYVIFGIGLSACPRLMAQTNFYSPTNITGQLALTNTVNLSNIANGVQLTSFGTAGPETKPHSLQLVNPPVTNSLSLQASAASGPSMSIAQTTSFGFNGVSHRDQRLANNGNQFSTEPATPGIAVGNGFILEGVDNAIQVYSSTSGLPLLSQVVAVNQLLGVSPQIDRNTGINGVYTTDMRVFWDPDIQRFMVYQWSQANDIYGDELNSSTAYLAVSKTSDPTGVWNVYTMNSTDYPANLKCPCVPDYPQIGADQNGLYISSNEFNTASGTFTNAEILAISKSQLGSGAITPNMIKFLIPSSRGYEFAIQPATTPPGASYYTANGGVEYFVSSISGFSSGSNVALWAMANTSSLNYATPALTLEEIFVPCEAYAYPNAATQKPGTLVEANIFSPTGKLPLIDGGPDSRVLSLSYAGGRLYLTMQVQVTDQNGKSIVGGAYIILSPALRATLTASVLRQGYLLSNSQHILRPVIAVNALGRGAIVFTVVGPNYYPSAGYVPINLTTTGSTIQMVGPGGLPEDGFTGYCPNNNPPGCGFGTGTARWGDNAAAVIASDGSMWGVTEYIPGGLTAGTANWGTFVMKIAP